MSKFNWSTPVENWTRMPNTLIDALPMMTSMGEVKILLYVLRHTWGWQEFKSSKLISLDEFEHGRKRSDGSRIDNGTGLTRNSIRDGIKHAIDHGFLEVVEDTTDRARIRRYYRLSSEGGEILTPLENSDPEGEKLTPPEGEKLTLWRATSHPRTEKETLERKNTKKTTNSAREDVEPNLTSPRARENFSQNSPAQNPSRGEAVRLGSSDPSPVLDVSILAEEETAQSEEPDSEPDDRANGDLKSLSAAPRPPPPPGLTPAQSMALGMLTDLEVGAYSQDVARWTKDPRQAFRVIQHAGAWWSDHYLRKEANTVGSLKHRIDKCNPNQWPKEFLSSDFYRRHYPLAEQEAKRLERVASCDGLPVRGMEADRAFAANLPPDLVRLLDKLPAPVWEVS